MREADGALVTSSQLKNTTVIKSVVFGENNINLAKIFWKTSSVMVECEIWQRLLLLWTVGLQMAASGRYGGEILRYNWDDLLLLRHMDYPAPDLDNCGELILRLCVPGPWTLVAERSQWESKEEEEGEGEWGRGWRDSLANVCRSSISYSPTFSLYAKNWMNYSQTFHFSRCTRRPAWPDLELLPVSFRPKYLPQSLGHSCVCSSDWMCISRFPCSHTRGF